MTKSIKFWGVVPAAGVGKRMQADRPKQYLGLAGKTVLEQTLARLLGANVFNAIVVAISAEDPYWAELEISLHPQVVTAPGGKKRLAAVLLLPTAGVHAQTPRGDVFLLGQNYTLEEGEELNGSLAVIGGNVTIEENAVVEGDVFLGGGNLDALGSAKGDIVLIGGSLDVSDEVSGDTRGRRRAG